MSSHAPSPRVGRRPQAPWTAAQAEDIKEKIRLSAREIAGYKTGAIFASPFGLIPGPHQLIVGCLLLGLCRALCLIWGVPKNFRKSLRQKLALPEVFAKQFSVLQEKFNTMMGQGASPLGHFAGVATDAVTPLVHSIMTTAVMENVMECVIFRSVVITPAVEAVIAGAAIGWVYTSRNDPYNSMMAMVSLGLMVSGAILHVKVMYDGHGWDEERSEMDYGDLIQEFVDLHGFDLLQRSGESHSVWDIFNHQRDREHVGRQLAPRAEYLQRVTAQSQPDAHNDELMMLQSS